VEKEENLFQDMVDNGEIQKATAPEWGVREDGTSWTGEPTPTCTVCNKVRTSNGVCKRCKRREAALTHEERVYIAELKEDIKKHTDNLQTKMLDTPDLLDYTTDVDNLIRLEKIKELQQLGYDKSIWVWEGVPMFCTYAGTFCGDDCVTCKLRKDYRKAYAQKYYPPKEEVKDDI